MQCQESDGIYIITKTQCDPEDRSLCYRTAAAFSDLKACMWELERLQQKEKDNFTWYAIEHIEMKN